MLKSELEAENNKLKNKVKKLERENEKLGLQLAEMMYEKSDATFVDKLKALFS